MGYIIVDTKENKVVSQGDYVRANQKDIKKIIDSCKNRNFEVYDFSKGSTYGKAIHDLRQAFKKGECNAQPLFVKDNGRKVVRPLTFKETIEKRVNDYNVLENPDGSKRTEEKRLRLFNVYLDSCTGIANKKNSKKFKIVPVCKELILIDKNFNDAYLPVDYNSIGGNVVDGSKGKFNQLLTEREVLNNAGWIEALEGDKALLKEYSGIVYSLRDKGSKLMAFRVNENTSEDQLRALCLDSIGSYSNAGCSSILSVSGRLLWVAQRK